MPTSEEPIAGFWSSQHKLREGGARCEMANEASCCVTKTWTRKLPRASIGYEMADEGDTSPVSPEKQSWATKPFPVRKLLGSPADHSNFGAKPARSIRYNQIGQRAATRVCCLKRSISVLVQDRSLILAICNPCTGNRRSLLTY